MRPADLQALLGRVDAPEETRIAHREHSAGCKVCTRGVLWWRGCETGRALFETYCTSCETRPTRDELEAALRAVVPVVEEAEAHADAHRALMKCMCDVCRVVDAFRKVQP